MNHAEAQAHITWLLANGFQHVGAKLDREQARGKPRAYTTDGQPIWKR